ncbi:MAG: hypothetical protein AAF191_08355 [Verrucomicrobiota bacterium]
MTHREAVKKQALGGGKRVEDWSEQIQREDEGLRAEAQQEGFHRVDALPLSTALLRTREERRGDQPEGMAAGRDPVTERMKRHRDLDPHSGGQIGEERNLP